MLERKPMTVTFNIKDDEARDYIIGRAVGMLDAVGNDGLAFTMNMGYALEHREITEGPKAGGDQYIHRVDVTRREFNKLYKMLELAYGNGLLLDYTVESDWL